MGNASSNANNNRPNAINRPQNYNTSRLRTKKKSLELPDLASLASPISANPVLNPTLIQSTPIPIPTSPNSIPYTPRPQNNFASTQDMPDVDHDERSTHIPLRVAHHHHISTTSVSGRRNRLHSSPSPPPSGFVPEVVHSSIPLALPKAEEEIASNPVPGLRQYVTGVASEDPKPVSVKVVWMGGGKTVVLARAGDNNWKGRHPMEQESSSADIWFTHVSLLPGTHHIKFIVDDQWRLSDDLPTAVDDDGSLANYVTVSLGPSPPRPSPVIAHLKTAVIPGQSFWSNDSDNQHGSTEGSSGSGTGANGGGLERSVWTSQYPLELLSAAREEEQYLASSSHHGSSSVPAPNIPPAPVLPRHLDKLILNVRPGGTPTPPNAGGLGAVLRSREREEQRRGRRGRTSVMGMGMAASVVQETTPMLSVAGSQDSGRGRLDVPVLADDNSVLPVPSHVVLHHLSTSAIKNGMLAVATTTRYRKKYLTTIYYKPT